MLNIIFKLILLCLIPAIGLAQSANVKVWDGVRTAKVTPYEELYVSQGTNKIIATGNITANGQTIVLDVTDVPTLLLQVAGTFGATTFALEASTDGVTWIHTTSMSTDGSVTAVPYNISVSGSTPAYGWLVETGGFTSFRIRATTFASGTQTWTFSKVAGKGAPKAVVTNLLNPHPISGTVTANIGTATVTATSLAKNEDAVHSNGDTGIATWAVRQNVPTPSSTVNNDYVALGLAPSGGLWTDNISPCNTGAFLNITTASTTELVPLTAGQKIKVCYMEVLSDAITNVTPVAGTGSNCVTSPTSLSFTHRLTAQDGWVGGNGGATILETPASQALCITNSATANVGVYVWYGKYAF